MGGSSVAALPLPPRSLTDATTTLPPMPPLAGRAERAERIVVLAFALLFPELLIATLWVMLVLTAITAVQRFVKVWKQATAEHDRPTPARRARRRPRTRTSVEPLWRQRMRERREARNG